MYPYFLSFFSTRTLLLRHLGHIRSLSGSCSPSHSCPHRMHRNRAFSAIPASNSGKRAISPQSTQRARSFYLILSAVSVVSVVNQFVSIRVVRG